MIGVAPAQGRPAAGLLGLWHSTVGKKIVMAITGFILFGFVVMHLWGTLKVYQGPEYVNTYGVFLREVGSPVFGNEQLLWIIRVVLLGSVILHVMAAVQLTRRDRASRPVGYSTYKPQASSYAARTMFWGGIIVALFVVYHVLHFTTGTVHPDFRYEAGHADIYHNMVSGFSVWYVSLFYIVSMAALGLHIYHGFWSMFQTVGLNSVRWNSFLRGAAVFFAAAIFLGNASVPVAVLAGILR